MKRIIVLTVCLLMLLSVTVYADPNIDKGNKDVNSFVTPMYVPCPLPSHDWIYEDTVRETYQDSHYIYRTVYDDYGNEYREIAGICYDLKEKTTVYYSCRACPATKKSTSTRTLDHDPELF